MQIKGTVALVTGANRGIGKAFAEVLFERGATKVYAAVRDPASIGDSDPRLVPVRLDVTDSSGEATERQRPLGRAGGAVVEGATPFVGGRDTSPGSWRNAFQKREALIVDYEQSERPAFAGLS